MNSWERWECLGYLGADPVKHYPGSDSVVVNFQIALNRKVKGEEKVEWRRCRAWGKTADLIAEHLKKGDPILITDAYCERDSWIDKHTAPQNEMYYVVRAFQFIGSKKGSGK